MTKIVKGVVVLVVALNFAGCASFRSKAQHLSPEMDKDQVLDVMGKPEKSETSGIEEALEYKDGIVLLRDGKLFFTHQESDGVGYRFSVSSLSSGESAGKNVILVPGMSGVSNDDLQFRQYAKYVAAMLQAKGYTVVDDDKKADLAIMVLYGISEPNTTYQSVPMWGQVSSGGVVQHKSTTDVNASGSGYGTYGGNSYSSYGTAYGTATTRGTSYIPAQYGVVGTRQVATTTFTRYLTLEAVDYRHYLKTKQAHSVWSTKVVSTGSLGDLRVIFPALLIAASDYIDKDSHNAVTWTLFQNDPRLVRLNDEGERYRLPASQ